MRDLLVRYLLGELNAHEREQLEAELEKSPELRRELSYLRACLPEEPKPPAADGPPSGLASRTLERITTGHDPREHDPACTLAREVEPPAGNSGWGLADMTAAAGMFLAVAMLFLPAMRQSRDAARRTECSNNLRELGALLTQYSDDHGGFFPVVGRDENAGVYALRLVHERYVTPQELAKLLVCRSSEAGERIATGQDSVQLPCRKGIKNATMVQLVEYRRNMSPSYAYTLGYVAGDRYYGIRNEHSVRAPLLSDAPSYKMADLQSANHGGCGQNVLHHDGSVGYQKSSTMPAPEGEDHLFLNVDGVPEAGQAKTDSVLGRSESTPGLVPEHSIP
jgi:hypothetical protein